MFRLNILKRAAVLAALLFISIPQVLSEGLKDARELENYMDGFIGAMMESNHVAGAAISVVKDGRIFFMKGYGYSDREQKEPVRPEKTLFRIGSVSKLFVWTAVMQLAEQGKLDLDTDINTYLKDFQIPKTYPEPITLKHLMTHSAGFEDRVVGLFSKDSTSLAPLGTILAEQLPARVRPPGQVISYSNHGTGIAAYIVEQVSGMTWDEYVETRIFQPLSMRQITFRQPIPEILAADMSEGYAYQGGEYGSKDFEIIPLAPVGAASAAAADMSRFMLAHLNLGTLDGRRILKESTARQMRDALFNQAPDINPMAHGFFTMNRNGKWIIGHGGDTIWFHTILFMLPEEGLGVFASFNSQGGGEATGKLFEAFVNRYFASPPVPDIEALEESGGMHRFEGLYRNTRYPHNDFTKLISWGGVIRIEVSDSLLKSIGEETKKWVRTDYLKFREIDGPEMLVFREDDQGRISHLFFGDRPYSSWERISGVDAPNLHLGILVCTFFLFLATLIFWPAAAVIRKQHGVLLDPAGRIPKFAYIIAWTACLLLFLFALGMMAVTADATSLIFGVPSLLSLVLSLPLAATALTVCVTAYTVAFWIHKRIRFWPKFYYTLLLLALLASLWQLNHWNLLGYKI